MGYVKGWKAKQEWFSAYKHIIWYIYSNFSPIHHREGNVERKDRLKDAVAGLLLVG